MGGHWSVCGHVAVRRMVVMKAIWRVGGWTGARIGAVSMVLGLACVLPDGIDVDPDVCPVSDSGQSLVEEFVRETIRDGLIVARTSGDNRRPFALSLLGVEQEYRGIAAAAGACGDVLVGEAVCESDAGGETEGPFWKALNRCVQVGCEAAGVSFATVYVTAAPIVDPADRHTVEYDTVSPAGHIVYDINPLIRWRVDQTDPSRALLFAELVGGILFTTAGSDSADLTHAGEIVIQLGGGEIESGLLEVIFPSLGGFGKTIRVRASILAGGSVSGTVSADEEVIAEIVAGADGVFTFSWLGHCAP